MKFLILCILPLFIGSPSLADDGLNDEALFFNTKPAMLTALKEAGIQNVISLNIKTLKVFENGVDNSTFRTTVNGTNRISDFDHVDIAKPRRLEVTRKFFKDPVSQGLQVNEVTLCFYKKIKVSGATERLKFSSCLVFEESVAQVLEKFRK